MARNPRLALRAAPVRSLLRGEAIYSATASRSSASMSLPGTVYA